MTRLLLLVLMVVVVSAQGKTRMMTDVETYPACLDDKQCRNMDGHACFQYFCYPWNEPELAVTAVDRESRPFYKSCRRKKDCGGGKCFRHHNKREVTSGICLESVDRCDDHEECVGKGGKCCNGYCCNEDYFRGIVDIPCLTDQGCQDLLMGDFCCIDIMGSLQFNSTRPNWVKKCCSNQRRPVVQPPRNLSPRDKEKLDKQISRMPHLQSTICESFEYDFMAQFPSCSKFAALASTTEATDGKPADLDGRQGLPTSKGFESRSLAGGRYVVAAMLLSAVSLLAL